MPTNMKSRDYDVYEILEELGTIKADSNKVEWLQTNFGDHQPLRYALKMNYCGTIQSILPEGEPPFTKEETDGPTPASLWAYLKIFPMIVRSAQSAKMTMIRIEQLFVEMLEAIPPKEAEMICLAKDRKLEERFDISLDMVNKAFPGLITQSAEMPEIVPPTAEERAEKLMDGAKALRTQAKELQSQARELETEAKALLKEAKTDAVAAE